MSPSTGGLSHHTQRTLRPSVHCCPGDKGTLACFLWGWGPHRGSRCSRAVCDPSRPAGFSSQAGWLCGQGEGCPPSPRPLPRGPPKGARPFLGSRSLSKQGRRGGWGRRPWGDLEAAGLGLVTPGALRGWGGGVPTGLLTPTSAEAGVPVRSPPHHCQTQSSRGWTVAVPWPERAGEAEGQQHRGSIWTVVSAHPGHNGPASVPTGLESGGGFAAWHRALPFAESVVVAVSLAPGGPWGIPTSTIREQTPLGTHLRAPAGRPAAAVHCHSNRPIEGPPSSRGSSPRTRAADLSARSGSDRGRVVATRALSRRSACEQVETQLFLKGCKNKGKEQCSLCDGDCGPG